MSTAKFAGRGAVMTKIAPHATGHERASDGTRAGDHDRAAGDNTI
jgi:hypothetical protein